MKFRSGRPAKQKKKRGNSNPESGRSTARTRYMTKGHFREKKCVMAERMWSMLAQTVLKKRMDEE